MKGEGKGEKGGKKGKEDDDGRWRQECSNTIVMADMDTDAKHWIRDARCVGLAELLHQFGERYNAKQLYRYYTACNIQVHKTTREVGEQVAAAQLHKQATGLYGFGSLFDVLGP